MVGRRFKRWQIRRTVGVLVEFGFVRVRVPDPDAPTVEITELGRAHRATVERMLERHGLTMSADIYRVV